MHEESDKPLKFLTSLISLKPRQILLAEQQRRQPSVNECGTKMVSKQPQQDSICSTGNTELKYALQKSILNYLHKNGLSKTLKRFLNEAQIESNDWKTSSVDLEDIYERYAVHCQDSDVKIKGSVQEDVTVEKDVSGLCVAEETSSKKKKKKENKIEENDVNAVPDNSEPIEHSKSADTDNIVKDKDTGRKIKSKEKKSKKKSDFVTQNDDNTKESGSTDEQKDMSQKESRQPFQSVDSNVKNTEILTVVSEKKLASSIVTNGHDKIAEGAGKAKDKKKKKRQTIALVDDGQVEKIITLDNNGGTDVAEEDGKAKSKKKKKAVSEDNESELIDNDKSLESAAKKVSKKRKSAACDDGEEPPIEDLVNGKSKRRKITELSEDKNVKNSQKESQKSSAEEAVERIKEGQLKNGVQGSVEQKSLKKERNTEPRTANAFQRVKAEEVQFSDERLQNNSYWAKSGAEYGYGAKAQEVLGQVKGRDFRHEKTKKKRGSYRGGQIDFGAHSVKFNYSEEE